MNINSSKYDIDVQGEDNYEDSESNGDDIESEDEKIDVFQETRKIIDGNHALDQLDIDCIITYITI